MNNFNGGNDNTVAYIMTPLKWGIERDDNTIEQQGESLARLRYPTKIGELINRIQQNFPNAGIVVWGYVALNYKIPAEKDEGLNNKSDRGIAIFQYDPNSGINGQNAPGFRLFYQQAVTEGLL